MKRYAVHPSGNVSFSQLVRMHKVPMSECVDMSRPEQVLGLRVSKLIHLRERPPQNRSLPKRCRCGGIDTNGDGDCYRCCTIKPKP